MSGEARMFTQDQLLAAQAGDVGVLMSGLEHVTDLQPFSGRCEPPRSPAVIEHVALNPFAVAVPDSE